MSEARSTVWRTVTLALLLTLGAGATHGQSDPILTAAINEGRFLVYTSQNTPFMESLTDRFHAEFPNIEMQVLRAPSSDILARLLAERASGRPLADIYIAWWDTVSEVVKNGYSAGYIPEDISSFPGVMDEDGAWMAVAAYASVIGYNTNNVSADEAPRTFLDLADQRWFQRLGLTDPRIGGGAYGYYYHMWKLHGEFFFQRLGQNDPLIQRQHAGLVAAVGAGQIDVSIAGEANWFAPEQRGAPLKVVYPEEGVSLTYWIYVVMDNAPNPNAARVFIDWLVSESGQEAIATATNAIYPLREGITPPVGLADLGQVTVLPTDFDEYLELQTMITERVAAALGVPAD